MVAYLFQPKLRTPSMCGQSFTMRQRGGDLTEGLCACFGHLDHRGALLEVVYAERRGEARRAGGRQDVVRPRAVVAE